jgi:hypothetical protein
VSLDPSVDDALSLGSHLTEQTSTESPAAFGSDVGGDAVDPVPADSAVDGPGADDLAADGPADQVLPAPAAELDPLAADAVELARAAAIEVGGTDVGDHVGMSSEEAGVVTHVFAATLPGYRGWRWVVTVARASGTSVVTVDEVVLLPGAEALRAPEWIPWAQRIRPGDLGAGDLLPADPDDSRLVPSFWSDDDPAVEDADDQLRVVADEVGLGRVRVLSRDGRIDSAERWVEGDFGPESPMAKQAPAQCGSCGFLVPVRGSLGAAFGVCANEYSSADARVVSVDFGCGAHSEAGVDLASRSEPAGDVYDSGELVVEANAVEEVEAVDDAEAEIDA